MSQFPWAHSHLVELLIRCRAKHVPHLHRFRTRLGQISSQSGLRYCRPSTRTGWHKPLLTIAIDDGVKS